MTIEKLGIAETINIIKVNIQRRLCFVGCKFHQFGEYCKPKIKVMKKRIMLILYPP